MTEEEHQSYRDTVKSVMTAVVLGSIFQVATLGMMILAFYIIDVGLKNAGV
jgi:hypothetical protein